MATNPKEYMAVYMANYRKVNPDAVQKADKNWREKNKEYRAIYMREYRAKLKAQKVAQVL